MTDFFSFQSSRTRVSNFIVWRATGAIFKVVAGRIIKINKTQNNNFCYSTFLCRTSYKLMLISLD